MNSTGTLFRVTTFGESHGKAMGAIIDGCPAGLLVSEEELSVFLADNDRPVPELATEREEPNIAEILSGTTDSVTLGTPLAIVIQNRDVRGNDYTCAEGFFRPGHGDYPYFLKHFTAPQSGGGRASGRECISRLAAGYIAAKLIRNQLPEYKIESRITELAGIPVNCEYSYRESIDVALAAAENRETTGGCLEITVTGVPGGLGGPVFGKLDGLIAGALMGIGGVKSIEIGAGKQAARLAGTQMNDQFACVATKTKHRPVFKTNNAGGILAGISTGEDIIVRIAVKPTPTLEKTQQGLTTAFVPADLVVTGRHDKNFTPRVAKIAEAMLHILLVDQLMMCGILNMDSIE